MDSNFWSRVAKGSIEDCWPWTGHNDGGPGYGRLQINKKRCLAHRVAWELANGQEVPEGQVVRHGCDNPACCNPAHLFIGSQKDNMLDKIERKNLNAPRKLSEEDVIDIYQLHIAGLSQGEIARQYEVTTMNISHIVRGNSWKHLHHLLGELKV